MVRFTLGNKPKHSTAEESHESWGNNFREAMGISTFGIKHGADMDMYFHERAERKLQEAMDGIKTRGVMAGAEELRYVLQTLIRDEGLIAAVNHIEEFGFEGMTLEERIEIKKVIDENIVTKKNEKTDLEKEYDQLVLGALLSYVLLILWLLSVWYFVRESNVNNCDHHSLDEPVSEECRNLYEDHTAVLQNITFGLVTAVTIASMDSGGDGEQSLQARFKAIKKSRREREIKDQYDIHDTEQMHKKVCRYAWTNPLQHVYDFLIFKSPEIFVFAWIVGGLVSLITTVRFDDSENPLFSTGQTWLGMAVTRTYTYFGVNKTAAKAGKKDTAEQQHPNDNNEDFSKGSVKSSRDGSNKTPLGSIEHWRAIHNNPGVHKNFMKRSRSPASLPPGSHLDKTDEYFIGDSDDDSIDTGDQDIANISKTERRRNHLVEEPGSEQLPNSEMIYSSRQRRASPWMVVQSGETLSLSDENIKKTQESGSLNNISLIMSADEELADGNNDNDGNPEENIKKTQESGSLNNISLIMSADEELADGNDDNDGNPEENSKETQVSGPLNNSSLIMSASVDEDLADGNDDKV